MTTLRDLGEREIIRQVIARYCTAEIGDDCAEVARESESIIVTTDPVPPPAAEVIGGDDDPYWKGWLLTIINASDLAAAAAEPLAFFVAAEAPPDFQVEGFRRFFEGIADACDQEGLVYAGGNIREGRQLQAVGTALGARPRGQNLSRSGITNGDLVAIVGNGGAFWLDALLARVANKPLDKKASPLFSPRSQTRGMRRLLAEGVLVAAMDNSDGLLPTLNQLADINKIGVTLDLDCLSPPVGYHEVRALIDISHERLWLGWGDWNVIVAVKASKRKKLEDVCSAYGIDVCICGNFDSEFSEVKLKHNSEEKAAPRLESERFAKDSWFSEGIDGYIHRLRTVVLPGSL